MPRLPNDHDDYAVAGKQVASFFFPFSLFPLLLFFLSHILHSPSFLYYFFYLFYRGWVGSRAGWSREEHDRIVKAKK